MSSNQFDISNKENNPTRANIFDALSQLEPDIKSESAYSRSNTQQLEDLSTDGTYKANTSKNWRLENIEPLNMKLTPSAEQHAHEYETHFPTLGQPVETLKPETDFRPELLSPVNIVASQVHVESATESAPATENVTTEWTSELKDPSFIEVKPHRHPTKKAEEEEEEEVLEPEEPSEPVEPVVVQPEIIQLERPPAEKPVAKPVIIQAPTIAPAKKWDELDEGSESKEAQVEETPIVESEPLKQSNPAKANIFQALSQLGPKISEDASESSISRGNTAEEIPAPKPVETKFVKPRLGISVTPAVEEHAHEYESHFPTLGEEPTLQPETEFKPEILSPVNIVAESILSGDFTEVKPNRRAPAKNISEEPEEIITEPEVSEAPAVTRSQVIQLDRSTTQEKPVAKPAIYEAPTIAPAKEWNELAKETEKKEVKVEVTPDLAKKSEKYEKLFPSLGEEPKDLGSETEFRREILNPINIVVAEAHGETPKVAINPEALNAPKPYYNDLDPIEEKIETQDDDVKPHAKRGLRSSLEHLHEENVMNQSTELTLSAGRIDLIREELRENETRALSKDLIFQDVERALVVVRDLEKAGQYGEAIRLLKKNLETLDARFMHNDTFDLNEMNKLLFELNLQLAGCYHHINEISYAIDHARAAMKFKSDSPKAIYLLGTGLLRAGQLEQGYDILKQIRRILLPGGDGYEELIEHELRIYERRAQEVLKDIEEPVKEEKGASAWAGLGAFAGTALAGGIASWFAMRNYLGLSEKKSLIYSVGAGTVIGGLSLILMGHNNKVK